MKTKEKEHCTNVDAIATHATDKGKSKLLLPHSVSKFETLFYIFGWATVYGYSAYSLYIDSRAYRKHSHYNIEHYFTQGWNIFNTKQDISNIEWQFWKKVFLDLILTWMIGHVILARFVEGFLWQYRKQIFILYGIVAVSYITGAWAISITLSHCLVMYGVMHLRRRWLLWLVDLALIGTLNYHPFTTYQENLYIKENDYLLFNYSLALTCHRYLAFCLDNVENPKETTLADMLFYIFYFPLYFCGPLINYDKFKNQISVEQRVPWSSSRVVYSVYRILRIVFWMYFIEFIIHYLYFAAMHVNKRFLRSCSLWTLAGLDFCQGQFFQVVYVVFFGMPAQIAALDGIQTVGTPRCVATICYYSDMWKKFDRGLHEFLKKYIYIASGGSRHGHLWQLTTSLLCFLYVGYWHGGTRTLFYWVLLNYVQVSGEALISLCYRAPRTHTWINSKFSPQSVRRLQGVLTVPLLAASLVSIHAFFDDMDVCWIYVQRFLLHGDPFHYLVTFISLYMFVQASLEADIWEAQSNGKIISLWKPNTGAPQGKGREKVE